jgi:transposase
MAGQTSYSADLHTLADGTITSSTKSATRNGIRRASYRRFITRPTALFRWSGMFISAPKAAKPSVRWLSANSVGRLLAQLGITCQKPLHRAQERDEALVEQWLKKKYPRIKALAQLEKADIFFGDAAHIRSDHHAGRTWGKKGETPVVTATGARHGMSLISAITSRGQMRFMIKEKGGVNAAVFIEFLNRLITGAKRPIFLIVDRGPAHIAKQTKAFVKSLNGRLRLFYVPPYSPDRNPDELVWKHLQSRHCRPDGDYRQGGFPHQGPSIYAPITKRRRENPFLLPKTVPQIRSMNVRLLMY